MKPFLIACVFASAAAAAPDSQTEIRALIANYARSVDTADVKLAAGIWSAAPDVTFIHPLGHEHGFHEIRDHVYSKLMGETFSARKLAIEDTFIRVNGNTAWAEFYWDFTATLRQNGEQVKTAGRETQIYRREHGAWRIVHVHYSAMPATPPAN